MLPLTHTTTLDSGLLGDVEVLCEYELTPCEPPVIHPVDRAHEGAGGIALLSAIARLDGASVDLLPHLLPAGRERLVMEIREGGA